MLVSSCGFRQRGILLGTWASDKGPLGKDSKERFGFGFGVGGLRAVVLGVEAVRVEVQGFGVWGLRTGVEWSIGGLRIEMWDNLGETLNSKLQLSLAFRVGS